MAQVYRVNFPKGMLFEKCGYTPHIATVSNGRFAEAHNIKDMVEIGLVSFDVKRSKIVRISALKQEHSMAAQFMASAIAESTPGSWFIVSELPKACLEVGSSFRSFRKLVRKSVYRFGASESLSGSRFIISELPKACLGIDSSFRSLRTCTRGLRPIIIMPIIH